MKPETLSGKIKRFKGDGRKLGYPTANLDVETSLADGVYFGYADLARWQHQPALIFVGVPLTMGEKQRRVEAYLLDIPDKDYYDQQLKLSIEYFHRSNQTFDSMEKLMEVMRDDEAVARRWFSSGSGRP